MVVYDLKFKNTKPTDYTNVNKDLADLINDQYFIGSPMIQKEIEYLMQNGVINEKEAKFFFGTGYAAKRNAALYIATKNKMDYLLFLDDDEYPVAVTKTHSTAIWGGQHILKTHLQHIINADITNGQTYEGRVHVFYSPPITITGLIINHSSPVHAGSSANFTATVATGGNISYEWQFVPDAPVHMGTGQSLQMTFPITYTAWVTATNGSGSVTASKVFTLE